ncbi:PhnD/SsuA/transferrin family substrate-binding protein [Limoniibacter endophyticus]|uniref:Phosphonate ABC transporter substrate-binding protein n=1 Tax=Limoniibacter endophyticus TaxID=1565040 RepID=A0A8J3DHG9_9HYPH|nr:PhnD/SsuA/transferrin family substrate-binding protein [Limoniibacter endophyticus]GHC67110.1 phosphonate ABC transporter substrate-binding protein [Limoniibacter endophyticus]
MPKPSLSALVAACFSLSLLATFSQAQEAGWRDQIGTFKIGLVVQPGQPLPDRTLIREAFSRQLGMPADIVLVRDYPSLIDAQASGRVDYAIYSSLAYAAGTRFCKCVSPLVMPLGRVDGEENLRVAGQKILIRERSNGAARLRRLVAAQDTVSFHAWDLVRAEYGFPADMKILPAPTQEEARKLFAENKADMILDWELVSLEGERIQLSENSDDGIVLVWESGAILPLGIHAVRKNVPAEARKLLLSMMEGEDTTSLELFEQLEPVYNAGFVEATEADVAPAIAVFDGWIETQRTD